MNKQAINKEVSMKLVQLTYLEDANMRKSDKKKIKWQKNASLGHQG